MKRTLKIVGGIFAVFIVLALSFVVHANWAISNAEIRAYDEGAPGRYTTIEGHRWHVATAGDLANDPTGAPLLLIHGFLAPGQMNFRDWKDKLAAHRAVVIPDLLSYGHSKRVTESGDHYTLSHTSKALAAILDELGVAQVDVVGHSYGSIVAAQFAVDYPACVRRIVFMSTSIEGLERTGQEDVLDLPFGIGRAVAWHIVGGGRFGVVGMSCAARPDCGWMSYTHIKDNTDSMRAAMRTTRIAPDLALLKEKAAANQAPALVLIGVRDFLFSTEGGKRDAALLPNGRFAAIAEGSHMPYLRKPDETLKAVIDFLQPAP